MTDVDWLSEVQQAPASLSSRAPKLPSLLVAKNGQTIQTTEEWEQQKHRLRVQWREFLGRIAPSDDACPKYDVLERESLPNVERLLIRYETEPGMQVEAYLLRPRQLRQPAPGVIAFHSTVPQTIRQPAGVEGAPEKAFGLRLAERGHVVLCPRCFLWRDGRRHFFLLHAYQQVRSLRKRHGNIRGMAKLLYDAQRSLDVLVGMPEVAEERWGFKVGVNLGTGTGMLLWRTPLKVFQKILFHTPIVNIFIFASEVYHDRFWYPLRGRKVVDEWLQESPWGKLFQEYPA